ncbi:MAG: glycosyltransferase [Chloroflexi bacterium]|nr:glycosyltransferase [Chloroflexota bacterium]
MRIAYLVLGKDIAGGETVCLQQMRAARERGHDVCILVPERGTVAQTATASGFEVYELGLQRTFHLRSALKLSRFLKNWRADLLHTHTMVSGMILARLGARLARVPLISHVHAPNVFSHRFIVRSFQRMLDRLTLPLCDAFIAVSEDTFRRFVAQGGPITTCVIPNGVTLQKVQEVYISGEVRRRWSIGSKAQVIGCVGRLEKNKGQLDIVRAFAQVQRAVEQEKRLFVVGNDTNPEQEYATQLKRVAKVEGVLQDIVFAGYQPNAAELMHGFDIFVLPSYREAMPMTILEAMAAGKPVIATCVNGVPEVVADGETGILVEPGDVKALADALLRLLRDRDLALRMGEAGRQRVREHFSLEKLHERLFAIYDEVVAKRRG